MKNGVGHPLTWTVLVVLAVFLGGGCRTASEEQRRDPEEKPLTDQEVYLEENKTKEGVVTTASGLQYKVVREGKGRSPEETGRVTVHYRGRLIDGTEFDSSHKRGEPAVFRVNGVIRGWVEGLQLMKEGGKIRLFIPSDLAYGKRGAGKLIGPDATLVFDVELLEVWEPDETVDGIYGDVEKASSRLRKGKGAEARALYERGLSNAEKAGLTGMKKHRSMLMGAHYNLACLFSLASVEKTDGEAEKEPPPSESPADRKKQALANLEKSFALGWKDFGHIRKDTDLDPIRDLPAFKALLEKWERKPAK